MKISLYYKLIGNCSALFLFFQILTSCGYRYDNPASHATISVPYIAGDGNGKLTQEIMRGLALSHFHPVTTYGDYELKIAIAQDSQSRIGFQYDRDPGNGKRLPNLVGVENRRALTVEITLIDRRTERILLGPKMIQASVDFDYVNEDSIRDLIFINQLGKKEKIIQFSMGQLDSIEGAQDTATTPLFRSLAQKIVEELLASI